MSIEPTGAVRPIDWMLSAASGHATLKVDDTRRPMSMSGVSSATASSRSAIIARSGTNGERAATSGPRRCLHCGVPAPS